MADRGRPPAPGKIYYLGRLRFRPGIDPPELQDLLERLDEAGPVRRRELLRAALIGGLNQAAESPAAIEDDETAALMDNLLGDL